VYTLPKNNDSICHPDDTDQPPWLKDYLKHWRCGWIGFQWRDRSLSQ